MKKLAKLSFVLLTNFLLLSCQKEKLTFDEPQQNEMATSQNQKTASRSHDSYVYIKDDAIIQESEIKLESDNTTLIYDDKSNNVYVFDSDEKVRQWAIAQNTEFSNNVLTDLDKLVKLQNYIDANNVEQYFEKYGTTPRGYDEFYNSIFGNNGSMRGSTLNFLHDDPNAAISGSIWLPISYPRLSSVNFNDRTSAVSIALSAIWLCRNNWYRGSKAYFGALAQTYTNIAFNNVASSVIKL